MHNFIEKMTLLCLRKFNSDATDYVQSTQPTQNNLYTICYRKIRRHISFFITPIILSSLIACGGGGGGDNNPAPAPASPASAAATPLGFTSLRVTWDSVPEAKCYEVYASRNLAADIAANGLNTAVLSCAARLAAIANSPSVSTPSVSTSAVSTSAVSYSAVSLAATSAPPDTVLVATVIPSNTTSAPNYYDATGLSPNSEYTYSIAACDSDSCSTAASGSVTTSGNKNGGDTIINSTAELNAIRADSSTLAGNYILAADIDLSSITNWQPIGNAANPFTGSFDGGGHEIKGITTSGYEYAGLFGYVQGASISNFGARVNSIDSSSTSAFSYAGGLAGYTNNSVISNVYIDVAGNVSSFSSNLSASSYSGGLLGYADNSEISNLYVIVRGSISSTSNSSYAGGLLGYADGGLISNSYYSASRESSQQEFTNIYGTFQTLVGLSALDASITGWDNTTWKFGDNTELPILFSLSSPDVTPPPIEAPSGFGDVTLKTLGFTSLDISWVKVSKVDYYEIYNSRGEEVAIIDDASVTSYTITGLAPNTGYTYRVRACNKAGCSVFTSRSVTINPIGVPKTPQVTLGASSGGELPTSLSVSWEVIEGVTSYQILNTGGENVANVTTTTTHTLTDLSLSKGTRYGYQVRGCADSDGSEVCGGLSPIGSAITIPSGVTATPEGITSLKISWNRVKEATHYIVRNGSAIVAVINYLATSYDVTGLLPNTVYTYRLTACYKSVCSPAASITATTPVAIPVTPTGFIATALGLTSISMSWNSVAGAEYYQVSNNEELVANITHPNTSYTATGLSPDTEYTYRVRACNVSGCSPAADITATTPVAIPVSPGGVTFTALSSTSLSISWESVVGAVTYEVRDGGGRDTTISHPATSYTATGLSPNTEYTYRVRACNVSGCSDFVDITATTPVAIPVSPGGVTFTALSSTSLSISWESVVGAENYEVRNSGALVANTTHPNTSYTATGLSPNTEYTYRVRACNTSGCSGFAETTATTSVAIPVSPGGVTFTALSSTSLSISWESVVGAENYEVRNSDGLVTNITHPNTSYTATGLSPDTEYTYRVRACNVSGCSPAADITATTPVAIPVSPGGVTFTALSSTSLSISWESVEGAVNYEVRNSDGLVTTINHPTTSYTLTGLLPNTEYTYRVRACNVSGCSGFAETTATTPVAIPVSPSGVTFTALSSTSLSISWESVVGSVTYEVRNSDGLVTNITHPNTSYIATGLSPNTEYTYRVRACNVSGCSPAASITATTSVAIPVSPGGVTFTALSSTSLSISWESVVGAENYEVRNSDGLVTNITYPNTSYTATGLSPNTEYTYRVRACNTSGCSDFIDIIAMIAIPVTPIGFTATALGLTSISMSWNSVDGAEYYQVSNSDGLVTNITHPNTSYTVTGLSPDTEYTYRVIACNSLGCSGFAERTATTPVAIPISPSDVTFTALSSTLLSISWESVVGAENYEVRNSDGLVTNITHPNTSYTATGLSPNTEYTYRVRACNTSGCSPAADITATTSVAIPVSPGGVTFTALSSTSLSISWESVVGAENYEVRNNEGLVANTTHPNTSYTATGLSSNTEYTYRVRACNTSGCSGFAETTATTSVAIPVSPGGVTFTALSSTSLSISWESVVGAENYEVRNSDGLVANITHPNTSYTATGLSPNTEYTYRVRACNTSGCSDFVDITAIIAIPVTPIGFTATALSPTSLSISWESVEGAENYEVRDGDGLVTNITHPNTSYTATGLSPDTEYTYRVIACNSLGCSGFAERTATTPIAIPVTPSGVTFTALSSTSLSISWESVVGAENYEVRNSGALVVNITHPNTSYTATGLSSNTEYTYRVRACNVSGCSPAADITATTPVAIPDVPSGVTFTALSPTSLSISWESVVGAVTYEVRNSDGLVTNITHPNTSYTATGLSPNTEYTYRVRACNVSGCSDFVDITATTPVAIPDVPSGVTFTALSSTSLSISWESVVGAVTYEVRNNEGLVANTTHPNTSYTATGLSSNTEYTYRVRACNVSGCSPAADITATTPVAIPVSPGGVTFTALSSTSISMSWSSVAEAEYYQVRNSGGELVANITHPNISYTATALSSNTEYTYRVRACNVSGCSPATDITATTPVAIPVSPSGVTFTALSSISLSISWESVVGAVTYEVRNSGALVANTTHPNTSYIATGLSPNTEYTYRVRACNVSGCSDFVDITAIIAIPVSPGGVTFTALSSTSISMSWNSVDGADYYQVRNSEGLVANTTHPNTSYIATGLSPNTEYTYRVRACNVSGCSDFVDITAIIAIPVTPIGFTATALSSTSLSMSWNSVAEAEYYQVRNNEGLVTNITHPNTSYIATGLSPDTEYTYRVRACNSLGCSGFAERTTTTPATPPVTQPVTPPTVPSGTTSIGSAEELAAIRANNATLSGAYALTGNIDLSAISNWQPIGDRDNKFTGSFDGRGYEISGVSSSGYRYAGLFGYVENASISNVGVLVGDISSSSNSSTSAGGLVGWAGESQISNSYVEITGDIYSNYSSNDSSNSFRDYSSVGGLVGWAGGSQIINSYVEITGYISSFASSSFYSSSSYSYAGGLVGWAEGNRISNSYAQVMGGILSNSSSYSSYAGGLVGFADYNEIIDTYAAVTGDISSSYNAGGLVGFAADNQMSNTYYSASRVSSQGGPTNTFGTSLTAIELRGLTAASTGWDGTIWNFGTAADLPTLRPLPSSDITLPSANVVATALGYTAIRISWAGLSNAISYEVHNSEGLVATIIHPANNYIARGLSPNENYTYRVRACNLSGCSSFADASATTGVVSISNSAELAAIGDDGGTLSGDYILTGNINLSAIPNWKPIGDYTNEFTGSFDGNGYRISGINSADYEVAGLFGYIEYANISNVGVLVGDISSSSSSGGLVGSAYNSQITNSYVVVTGGVSSSGDSYTYAGGLVGEAYNSQITNSYAVVAGGVLSSSLPPSSSSSRSFIASYAGGLVGFAGRSPIINSYAVVAGGISSTSESSFAGGLVGAADNRINFYDRSDDSGISGSYYSARRVSLEGKFTNAHGTFQTIVELNALTALSTGWDGTIWDFGTTEDLPTLRSLRSPSPTITLPIPSTPPASPDGVTATALVLTAINIFWDSASDSDEVFHEVHNSRGEKVATINYPATNYIVSGLLPNTGYTYNIRACNLFDCSDFVRVSAVTKGAAIISSAAELMAIGSDRVALSSSYNLTGNIDLSDIPNWQPIGNLSNPFTGDFEGNGYNISGISSSGYAVAGLFGYVEDANIRNVGVLVGDISSTPDFYSSFYDDSIFAGGLVGWASNSQIVNSYVLVAGSISSSSFSSSYAGGLVGRAEMTQISNSYVIVKRDISSINSWNSYIGGLVGAADNSQISNSYAIVEGGILSPSYFSSRSTSTGGLAGVADNSDISNSYAIVGTSISSGSGSAGGLIGRAEDSNLIGNSYYRARRASSQGNFTNTYGIPQVISGLRALTAAATGWDESIWNFGTSADLPTLRSLPSPDTTLPMLTFLVNAVARGSSSIILSWNNLTESEYYEVNNSFGRIITVYHPVTSYIIRDLFPNTKYTYSVRVCNSFGCSGFVSASATTRTIMAISSAADLMDIDISRTTLSDDYVLTENIDLSSISDWQPIGDPTNPFTGSFDGNGYNISGLSSEGYEIAGLFGYVENATISNLGVLVDDISAYSNSFNPSYAGGLVGRAEGIQIINSFVEIKGNISSFYSAAPYNFGSYRVIYTRASSSAGGLIGRAAKSQIINSYVEITGDISSFYSANSSNSNFNSNFYRDASYAGGLIGWAGENQISNSYVQVEGGILSNSSHTSSAGGLLGWTNDDEIINSYAAVVGLIASASDYRDSYSSAGGLLGDGGSSQISNSYYSAGNIYPQRGFFSSHGTYQTFAELRNLTAASTGWDGTIWHFGTAADLPTLRPVPSSDISLPPASVTATALGYTAIKISWTSLYNAISYEVHNSEGLVATIIHPATNYVARDLSPNESYTYRVRACNLSGCSSFAEVSATTGVISINDAVEFVAIGNNSDTLSGDYILTDNIDLSTISNFKPIGDSTNRFTGSFDGDGYRISRSNISGYNYSGLFGYVSGAKISNVGFMVGDISARSSAGGLVGRADNSQIINSYVVVTGSVSSADTSSSYAGGLIGDANRVKISNSYAVVVSGVLASTTSSYASSYAGGLVGNADRVEISNSYAVVARGVSALLSSSTSSYTSSNSGGLVGYAYDSPISNSYAVVAGGVSASSLSPSSDTSFAAGGLVGWNADSRISGSYYSARRASLEGEFTNAHGTFQTIVELNALTAASTGWDETIWDFGTSEDRPTLHSLPSPDTTLPIPSSTPASPSGVTATALVLTAINISWDSASDSDEVFHEVYNSREKKVASINYPAINYIASGLLPNTGYTYNIRACNLFDCSDFVRVSAVTKGAAPISSAAELMAIGPDRVALSSSYNLTGNIDLSGIPNWQPIGNSTNPFTGDFEGNGYNISGLSSEGYEVAGLFGYVENAIISNVGVLVNNISSSSFSSNFYSSDSSSYAGGLIGWANNSQIANSYVVVANSILSSSNSPYAGGLVGRAEMTQIKNSYAVVGANVSSTSSSYSSSYSPYAGGLVGAADNSQISNSYAIVEGSISSLDGSSYRSTSAGGLAGVADNSQISNSYAAVGIVIYSGSYYSGSSAGGLLGRAEDSNLIGNSYYRALRASSQGNFTNTYGTSQTVDELRGLTATATGWDESIWNFGTSADLPTLHSLPVPDTTLPMYIFLPSPGNFDATAQDSYSIMLSWNSVSEAEYYEVHDSFGSGNTFYYSTSHYIYGLSPDTKYTYRLRACNENGCSAFVNATAITPATSSVIVPVGPVTLPTVPSDFTNISNAEELAAIGANSDTLSGGYALTKNIDLSTISNWQPIGNLSAPFTGSFDGKGYNISGISSSGYEFAGLFGYVENVNIRNVGVLVGNISSTTTTALTASGGLIGFALNSRISNSYAIVSEDIYSSSSVFSSASGGLIGAAINSQVIYSYAEVGGDISATTDDPSSSSFAGGLAGNTFGSMVSDSYALVKGNIYSDAFDTSYAGGLTAYTLQGTVIDSYALVEGYISSNAHNSSSAGGLVGGDFDRFDEDLITNSYYNARRKSSQGEFTNTNGTFQTPDELRALTATATGWNTDIWDFGTNNDLPTLRTSILGSVPLPPFLAPPSDVVISDLSNSRDVLISWESVSGALYYQVHDDNQLFVNISHPTTSYIATGLLLNVSYTYGVRACNSNSCSAFTIGGGIRYTGISVPLPPVTNSVPPSPAYFEARSSGADTIFMYWGGVSGAERYELYNGNELVAYINNTDTSYTEIDLSPNTEYFYRLRACNDNGCSAFVIATTITDATPTIAPPIVPSDFTNISSAEELAAIRANNATLSGAYTLTENIDLSAISNWRPIGNLDAPFRGSFDGNGYNISGISSSGYEFAGLFGYVENVNIRNIGVLVGNISSSSTTATAASGGLIGFAFNGRISNSFAIVSEDIYSSSSVSSSASGGLIGAAINSQVIYSYAEVGGDISATTDDPSSSSFAGGLAGNTFGSMVSDSYALVKGNIFSNAFDASYAGGLTAYTLQGTVIDSYALVEGYISSDAHNSSSAGGLVGDDFSGLSESSISNSYYNASRKSSEGEFSNDYGTSQTPDELRRLTAVSTSWDGTIWNFGTNNDLPTLRPSILDDIFVPLTSLLFPPSNVEIFNALGFGRNVGISWDSVPGALYYEVHDDNELLAIVDHPTTSYIATGLLLNVSYTYSVRACNLDGCSAFSIGGGIRYTE